MKTNTIKAKLATAIIAAIVSVVGSFVIALFTISLQNLKARKDLVDPKIQIADEATINLDATPGIPQYTKNIPWTMMMSGSVDLWLAQESGPDVSYSTYMSYLYSGNKAALRGQTISTYTLQWKASTSTKFSTILSEYRTYCNGYFSWSIPLGSVRKGKKYDLSIIKTTNVASPTVVKLHFGYK